VRRVIEVLDPGPIPLWRNPEWTEQFPWLTQGVTGRGSSEEELDFGFFGRTAVREITSRWRRLRETTGILTSVHSQQIHGARVASWNDPPPPGMVLVEGVDAHVSRIGGILLTVSVADCVPIFLVGEGRRRIALAHAGWRGIAAGVVEAALGSLSVAGVVGDDVWLHCGPSICGDCYEVGAEVHEAINPGFPPPASAAPIDLVRAIADRAQAGGVTPSQCTASGHCTLCGPGSFFSHRGGSPARQLAVAGIRQ